MPRTRCALLFLLAAACTDRSTPTPAPTPAPTPRPKPPGEVVSTAFWGEELLVDADRVCSQVPSINAVFGVADYVEHAAATTLAPRADSARITACPVRPPPP